MSETRHTEPQPGASALWRRNGVVWLALLGLLLLSLWIAYLPLGSGVKALAGPLIALIKAALVGFAFMELARSRPLIRLTAMAGLVFVTVLFGLTATDVLARLLHGW
jgi:cytochrome c oxidase subunit 4